MVALKPFRTPSKQWLVWTGLVGWMGYFLGWQRNSMSNMVFMQQSQENGTPVPAPTTSDLRDLILKDIRIVENNFEQYNRYISARARNYGQLVDVFLAQAYMCQHGDPHQVFIDAGANIGQFTDMMFQLHGDQRSADMVQYWKDHNINIADSRLKPPPNEYIPTVYVFEPEPNNYQSLVDTSLRYPKGHVHVYHKAIADKAGNLPLYDGGSQVSGNTQGGLIPHGKQIGMVEVVSLDDFISENNIRKVNLAKIDVEGYEWEVFKGMEKSVAAGIIDLFTFEYGEKWNKKHGRPDTVTLKQVVDLFDTWGFDTFLIGQFNNVKVNGDGYDAGYEN
eukprot:scaffold16471_cov194-Amphora_coffeaeformis.AAC.2